MAFLLPRIISKGKLALLLECITKETGKISYAQLNKHYLNENFIVNVLKMDLQSFKKIRKLGPEITSKFYEHYKIYPEEFED